MDSAVSNLTQQNMVFAPRFRPETSDTEERLMATHRRSMPRARVARRLVVLVATRKGAWLYHGDAGRKSWRADGPHFLRHIVNHLLLHPRDGRTLLMAAKTGHLDPTALPSLHP